MAPVRAGVWSSWTPPIYFSFLGLAFLLLVVGKEVPRLSLKGTS